MIKKFLFCVFCCVSFLLQAQEPVFVNLSEKDGLPDKEFYNIIEDSKAFIWLCADKGLYRYDGKIFKNYTNPEKRGLSVFGVKEDGQGRIWCNNITGQFFYVENNTLKTFIDLKSELNGELANFEILDNYLLVFALNKIYKVHLQTKSIEVLSKTNFNYGNPYLINNSIYIDNSSSIFKLQKTDSLKEIFSMNLPYRNSSNKGVVTGKSNMVSIEGFFIIRQTLDQKNAFFIIDNSQNSFLQSNAFKKLKKETIQFMFVNGKQVWFCTTTGIWVYQFNIGEFQFKKKILSSKNISKVIKDKENNYWVTTLNNGVYVIPNIYIEQYVISEENNNITSLDKVDSQTILFGATSGKVGLYDLKTNTENIIDIPSVSRVSTLKYNPKKKISYIGLDDNGFILNHETLKLHHEIFFNSVKSFSILNNDELLLTDFVKVTKHNQTDIKNRSFISDKRRPYTSFFKPEEQTTFISYVDDLVKYDSLWQPTSVRYKNQPIYGLSMSKTNTNVLWVGSFKNGVYGIKNDSVVHYLNTKNGLISNRIEKLKADGDNLWIATDSGIQEYNTVSKTFKTLTKRDGIVSYDISGIEVFDDRVVFASKEGLFSVHKTKAFKQQKEAKVYFNQIEINKDTLAITSNYTLNHDQNTIKIGFNVNGFQFNQKGKYMYRLLGLNTSWTTTDVGENSVKYNSLPSGEYTFQVKPVLNGKTLESNIKALQFYIKKPFWKTLWFILCVSIVVLGSIIFYFRKKIKQKEAERQKEVKQLSLDNELIALKLENLRSQMNPHFIFNALNSIQEYIVLNQKKLASDYLGKFADLIRTYLSHSTKANISLQEEINCLNMYLELEKLRFEDKLHYTITVSGNSSPESVKIPTMLIQPYVENALKHGLIHRKTNRNLKISFFINDDTKILKCIIADNGVGREKAEAFKLRSYKSHKSFATKATKDRLELLNYGKEKKASVTITDLFDKEDSIGTQVNIVIPFTED